MDDELTSIERAHVRAWLKLPPVPVVMVEGGAIWEVVHEEGETLWCRPYDGPVSEWKYS
jgi:hypothetical protein